MIISFYKYSAVLLFLLLSTLNTNASSSVITTTTLLSIKNYYSNQKEIIEKSLFKRKERECLALGLYHEARGEPVLGQYAVGATILNRVRSTAYPDTICEVVFQNQHMRNRCQFSFACDGISDRPRNKSSYIKMLRLAGHILTNGIEREAKFMGQAFHYDVGTMTHYHRYDVNPSWSRKLKPVSQLGAHVFFKSTRVTKRYAY